MNFQVSIISPNVLELVVTLGTTEWQCPFVLSQMTPIAVDCDVGSLATVIRTGKAFFLESASVFVKFAIIPVRILLAASWAGKRFLG